MRRNENCSCCFQLVIRSLDSIDSASNNINFVFIIQRFCTGKKEKMNLNAVFYSSLIQMIAATLRLGECFPRASLCYIAILLYTNAVAKKKNRPIWMSRYWFITTKNGHKTSYNQMRHCSKHIPSLKFHRIA